MPDAILLVVASSHRARGVLLEYYRTSVSTLEYLCIVRARRMHNNNNNNILASSTVCTLLFMPVYTTLLVRVLL